MTELQGIPALYQAKITNVPIPGYLFSVDSEDNGRPSIDPAVLFKMVLIQHLYGLQLEPQPGFSTD